MIGTRNNLVNGDPAFPSRSISFDSASSQYTGVTNATMTWTHAVASDATAIVVAAFQYGFNFGSGPTVGGQTMTQIFVVGSGGIMGMWIKLNPPTGDQTISLGMFGYRNYAGSVSYKGVYGFGTYRTNGSVSGTATSVDIPSFSGSMSLCAFGGNIAGGATFSSFNQSTRVNMSNLLIGDADGAANVKFSASNSGSSNFATALTLK